MKYAGYRNGHGFSKPARKMKGNRKDIRWRVIILCIVFGSGGIAYCQKRNRAPGAGLFVGDAAQVAMAKIVKKLPSPPRVFSIEIQPTEMIVLAQSAGAPNHVDEYRYRTASHRTRGSRRQPFSIPWVVGPRPAQPVIINPGGSLEGALFDPAAVNLGAVAETAREASRRVALEGGGAVASIRIQRPLGTIEWDIFVRGPRESASTVADAQGRIHGINLHGTRRAESIDYTQGGEPLAAAVALLRARFGVERVFRKLEISRTGISIEIRDPQNPEKTVAYSCGLNGLSGPSDPWAGFPSSARAHLSPPVRESELFSLDDADWSRVPALGKIALEKMPIAGGRVFEISLLRPSNALEEKPVQWKVHLVTGIGMSVLGDQVGFTWFDAKSGEPARLELPRTLQKPSQFLEPENARRLLENILEDMGPAARFIELMIDHERASVGATAAKHPDELRRYTYTASERAQLASPTPTPVSDPSVSDSLFDAAELRTCLSLLADLKAKAFARLGMTDGIEVDGVIERLTFFKKSPFYPGNKKALLEIRCVSKTRGSGRVIYDLAGKEFDAVTPTSSALPDPEIEALFAEWQAVLKADAAAAAKVQATHWAQATKNGAAPV